MDISELINKCNFFNDPERVSFSQKVLINAPYLLENKDDNEICSDIETLFNTLSDRSYGSSYAFTQPPYADTFSNPIDHHSKHKKNENSRKTG